MRTLQGRYEELINAMARDLGLAGNEGHKSIFGAAVKKTGWPTPGKNNPAQKLAFACLYVDTYLNQAAANPAFSTATKGQSFMNLERASRTRIVYRPWADPPYSVDVLWEHLIDWSESICLCLTQLEAEEAATALLRGAQVVAEFSRSSTDASPSAAQGAHQ